MQLDTETLCRYRLERAKEDLQAAKVNHDSGLVKASINRSYYAIFHGIRAVNILVFLRLRGKILLFSSSMQKHLLKR